MRRKREKIAPDLTPIIDIVFILLIFFMVTSVFRKENVVLALNLPDLHAKAQNIKEKPVTIELSKNKLAVDAQIYNFDDLAKQFSSYEKDTKINIKIDKDVEYERVMKLFDILQQHNLTSFSLIANKAKE